MNKQTRNVIWNNMILTILLIVTGVMPYFVRLASATLTDDTQALISYDILRPARWRVSSLLYRDCFKVVASLQSAKA
jgi:hypothetical protein